MVLVSVRALKWVTGSQVSTGHFEPVIDSLVLRLLAGGGSRVWKGGGATMLCRAVEGVIRDSRQRPFRKIDRRHSISIADTERLKNDNDIQLVKKSTATICMRRPHYRCH